MLELCMVPNHPGMLCIVDQRWSNYEEIPFDQKMTMTRLISYIIYIQKTLIISSGWYACLLLEED